VKVAFLFIEQNMSYRFYRTNGEASSPQNDKSFDLKISIIRWDLGFLYESNNHLVLFPHIQAVNNSVR